MRPESAGGGGARNRFCTRCKGVVSFDATACPHCGGEIASHRHDYYNFSDFEPALDDAEDRAIRRTIYALALFIAAVLTGLIVFDVI